MSRDRLAEEQDQAFRDVIAGDADVRPSDDSHARRPHSTS